MASTHRVTIEGRGPLPFIAPGAFPDPAGGRILSRCAAIRDAQRRAVTQVARALAARDGHRPPSPAVIARVASEAPLYIAERRVLSETADDVDHIVTLQASIDPDSLARRLDELAD